MPIDPIPQIAQRYHVPEAKVRELYQQLLTTGGRQCQFNCDELGGPVQWMPGMVTVSRWNDHQLRTRVDGLCSELAAIVQGSETSSPEALKREPGTAPAGACVGVAAGESWWPASLGHPSASGEQNGMRYAYFPEKQRLLIQEGAHLQAYDTSGHQLTGVAQQQGHTRNLTFSSAQGPVDLKHLTCLPHLGR
jgi:hypothetical protein